LLVAQHGGSIGRDLWLFICRSLWAGAEPDFTSPLLQKWLLLLIGSCPDTHKGELGHLLQGVTKAAPKTLGLVLFRFLTSLRVTVSKGWTFDFNEWPGLVSTRAKADFEVVLVGESYHLEDAWQRVFKPLIPELARDYLRILVDRLQEMYAMFRSAEMADERHDPWSSGASIRERVLSGYHENSLVVHLLLDVVEGCSETPDGLPAGLIDEWLSSGVPTLFRIGLLSLLYSKALSGHYKVTLLSERGLLYPPVYGAEHETYAILVASYPQLSSKEKVELWQRIDEGPKHPAPEGITPEEWSTCCQHDVDRLTEWLGSRSKACPIALAALDRTKLRSAERREQQVVDRAPAAGRVVNMGPSPESAANLLSQPIDSQIEFLLVYQGDPRSPAETRAKLVAAVGDACAQNPQWAVSLLEELAKRQNWTSDLWEGSFWRLRLSEVPAEKLTWLLHVFEKHFATSSSLQGLAFFLFNGVEFTEQKAPPREILEALIRLSVHVWNQIKTLEPRKTDDFKATDWTDHAINHAAGRITEFWLKCWSFLRPQSPDPNGGWPEWLRPPLEDMVHGGSYAAQLGLVILGNQMPFIHAIDAPWVRDRLFPKFRFDQTGEEAFLLWEPHLKYGRLSRDLVIEMFPLYRQAFPHLRNINNDLAIGLYRHIAVIIYSCLVGVDQEGWLKDFLLGLTEEQRASWANQMDFVLRDFPEDRKKLIWEKWMREYWLGRLHGKPCKLASTEAGEMLECALSLEPVFSSAVALVLQGPAVGNRLGAVLVRLERCNLIQTQPEPVIRLLKWVLTHSKEEWLAGHEVQKTIMQAPKKKAFVPDLITICEHLARRNYAKAIEMKAEIQRVFVED